MRNMTMERSRTMDTKVANANTEKAKAKERAKGHSLSKKGTKRTNRKAGAKPKDSERTLVRPPRTEKQMLQALSQLH